MISIGLFYMDTLYSKTCAKHRYAFYIYIYIWSSFAKIDNSVVTIFRNHDFSLCIPINFNQTGAGLFDYVKKQLKITNTVKQ